MRDDDRPDITPTDRRTAEPVKTSKPRLKRLRLASILLAVVLLGLVSFVFGMFVSIASDLPSLTKFSQFKDEQSSYLSDDLGHPIGVLSQQNRVIVTPGQIPQIVKDAVISIEDKRFETNSGIDIRGIARAFVADIRHKGSVQGASTIEQQFIKNALQAQSHRTIFEKLREAALAYQLSHKWSKEKIITAYLNTIYFGNGAYGIEAAAQTYFGQQVNHQGCGTPGHELCVKQLQPWEAALLAGVIQSPAEYDPVTHPMTAKARRDVVLGQMLTQGYLTQAMYEESIKQPIPAPREVQAPQEQTRRRGRRRLLHELGTAAGRRTLRSAARFRRGPADQDDARPGTAARGRTSDQQLPGLPRRSHGFARRDRKLDRRGARDGRRAQLRRKPVQPRHRGRAPAGLVVQGVRPGGRARGRHLARFGVDLQGEGIHRARNARHGKVHRAQRRRQLHGLEHADRRDRLLGQLHLRRSWAEGRHRADRPLAHRMGITTPMSTNPAMTIGGLNVGVTPLDMAHAYETIAHGGQRVSGTIAEAEPRRDPGSRSRRAARSRTAQHRDVNRVRTKRVLPAGVAATETSMLETVLQYGTGRAAAIGQFAAGKTGTTSNYGDAWFVGWDSKYTVAVWVGYPNKLVPMTTDFDGGPVLGGTFPALIWHDFMISALQIDKASRGTGRREEARQRRSGRRIRGDAENPARPPLLGADAVGRGRAAGKPSTPGGTGNEAGAGAAPSAPPERAARRRHPLRRRPALRRPRRRHRPRPPPAPASPAPAHPRRRAASAPGS